MKQRHIAFMLEQAYGHIIPTLGITLELVRRGHRVSYAVTRDFASAISRIGAQAVVLKPLETRPNILATLTDHAVTDQNYQALEELRRARTDDSLLQLEALYRDDKPDLIMQDECEDFAGRSLALKWGIPQIRICPQLLPETFPETVAEDQLVMVTVPRFFQNHLERFDERFKFVGFIAEGRRRFFKPWQVTDDGRKVVLISVTTGLLPQIEFCKMAVNAFRGQPWKIVLSIGGGLDRVSEITPADLGELPENIQLNRFSSNLDILEHASVFIGQGGQGSTLEALYCGVPLLLIPPSSIQDPVACRVAELGLGARVVAADVSANTLRKHAASILDDGDTLRRVKLIQQSMREEHGAQTAADIMDGYLAENT